MILRRSWIVLCASALTATLACQGGGTDDVGPIDGAGGAIGTGGVSTGGTASGGAPITGGTDGGGGVCDPAKRCPVPIEMCSGGFCEPVCVDYFYCLEGAAYWTQCFEVPLYECPAGCEEKYTPDGSRIYTTTEAEVCNPVPASGGSAGFGGGGD